MNLLLDLPTDILCCITNLLDGKTNLRLYLTGNHRLIDKICVDGGVRQLSFQALSGCPNISKHIIRFQKLEALIIKRDYWKLASTAEWLFNPSDIAALPKSLKTLTVPFIDFAKVWMENIPSNLQHLTLPYGELDLLNLELPSTLETLRLGRAKVTSHCFAKLPRSLKLLQLSGMYGSVYLEHISKLPEGLQSLMLLVVHFPEAFDLLPNTLTCLSLPKVRNITSKYINMLPRNLKILHLTESLVDPSCTGFLPRGLTELSVPPSFRSHLKDNDIPHLPRGIKHLDLFANGYLTADCAVHLPPKMQEQIGCMPKRVLTGITELYVKNLPRTLTQIELPEWVQRNLSESSLVHFPRTLEALRWEFGNMTAPCSDLPPALKFLWLPSASGLTDDLVKNLPRNLTLLSIPKCKLISDVGIHGLPRQLRVLELRHGRKVTDFGLSLLPPTLTELYLSTNDRITDQGIKNLPRELKILDLSWAKDITDEGIAHLPPLLTDLNLASVYRVTDQCIPHLPQSLIFLLMSCAHQITPDAESSLPKSLHKYIFPQFQKVPLLPHKDPTN